MKRKNYNINVDTYRDIITVDYNDIIGDLVSPNEYYDLINDISNYYNSISHPIIEQSEEMRLKKELRQKAIDRESKINQILGE